MREGEVGPDNVWNPGKNHFRSYCSFAPLYTTDVTILFSFLHNQNQSSHRSGHRSSLVRLDYCAGHVNEEM